MPNAFATKSRYINIAISFILMIGPKPKAGSMLRIFTKIAYLALLTLFVLEFVFLNSNAFILYSFLFFVAFGVLLGLYQKWIGPTVMVSIGFVVVGSLMYLSNAVLLRFTWLNLSILGYYLLISIVIGMLISFYQHFSVLGKYASKMLKGKFLRYAPLAAAIVLIAAPIWPVGPYINHLPVVERLTHFSYYGNTSYSDSFTLISDPPPYQYVVNLCTNGTLASANVSIQADTPTWAFMFIDAKGLSSAINESAGHSYNVYVDTFSKYANRSLFTDGAAAKASITVPNKGCSYMALLYDNLTTAKIAYTIRYFGVVQGHGAIAVLNYTYLYTINGVSNVAQSINFVSSRYADALRNTSISS